MRQARTAQEPDVLGAAPSLLFIELLLCTGGFLFLIDTLSNDSHRKTKFIGRP